jgi:hypothetical protein
VSVDVVLPVANIPFAKAAPAKIASVATTVAAMVAALR